MKAAQDEGKTVDEYLDALAPAVREKLESLRQLVKEVAPEADEAMKYGMPTFTLHGNLIHFAAFKEHIGVYPTPSGIDCAPPELAGYKTGKGTLQFPLEEPLPLPLIRQIIELRVEENRARKMYKKK
jgi:uncharacterized protein YdhG (YjbR/CyaY superfamily)